MTPTKLPNFLEIPIIIRIVGDPKLVACKIFEGKEDPKTGNLLIPKSILVEDEIECRLKEYQYRDEAGTSQDLLIVFGIIEGVSKSSIISNFLCQKLIDFKKTTLVINEKELPVDYDFIYKTIEEMNV